jgi:hypothetical protein
MRKITSTDSKLRNISIHCGLDWFAPDYLDEIRVCVAQFESGLQGMIRQVATYVGPAIVVTMPDLKHGGCTTPFVGSSHVTLIEICGRLYAVEGNGRDGFEVSLSSDSQYISPEDEKNRKIAELDNKIELLKAQRYKLLGNE